MKNIVCAVAVFVALSLGFMSEAHSRPVAYKMLEQSDTPAAIVLTDEFHEACPVQSNAAVIYYAGTGVYKYALGCWVYDEGTDSIGIWWRFADGDERTQTLSADEFTKVARPSEPVI